MNTILKSWLFICLFFGSVAYADAQVYVRRRPPHPRVIIARPPAPRYVRLAPTWRPYRPAYRWHTNYRVVTPRPRAIWVPGHWIARRHGNVWQPGYWR
ncbi:hypothetical protein [Spirosoma koreense]